MSIENIKPCACTSEFQDQRYGIKQRVHTVTNKGLRCTVCGKEDSGAKRSK